MRCEPGLNAGDRWPRLVNGRQTRKRIPRHIRYGVFIRDGWRCSLCGAYGDEQYLHADHIIPWSASRQDGSANLRALCAKCNLEKSNYYYPEDLRQVLPIAAGCSTCQSQETHGDLHDYGTLALCMYCDEVGYSQMVDECWLDDCDCR